MRNLCLMILLLSSCSQDTVVPINLRKMVSDTTVYDTSDVKILESFEAPACGKDGFTSNVYKVKLVGTNDTVYVFEICEKMIWRNPHDYSNVRMVWTKGELIPDTIYVPKEAKVTYNKYKFLIGSVKKAEF